MKVRNWLYAVAAGLALYAAVRSSALLKSPPGDSQPAGAGKPAAAPAGDASAALDVRLAVSEAGTALLDAGKNSEAASYFEGELEKAGAALELVEGLLVARARLCALDSAFSLLDRLPALSAGKRDDGYADAFLAGARERRERRFLDAASWFWRSTARAEASGDFISAAAAARARAASTLANHDVSTALDASREYRRLVRSFSGERYAADADVVEAECLALSDRTAAAESLYAAALPRARAMNYRAIESRCLSGLGRLDDARGRYGEALARYRAALSLERAMGDLERIAVLLNDIGQVDVRARSIENALVRFKEAEAAADSCGLEWVLGDVSYGRGAVAETRGEIREAARQFQRSLSLHRTYRCPRGELDARLRLGYLRAALGEYGRAIPHYEHALAHYEKIEDLSGRDRAIAGLAEAHRRLGDFAKAEEHYGRALETKRALGDRAGEARTLHSLGTIADIRGRSGDALAFEREAMEIYEELGDSLGMGEVEFGMGSVHFRLGDDERALELYSRSFALAAELGDEVLLRRAADGMASAYSAAGRLDLASGPYETCLALARKSGDRAAAVRALNTLAYLGLERGERSKARSLAEEALRLLPAEGQDHLRARALYLLASADRGKGSAALLERALALADSSGLEELKWRCLSDLGERALEAGDTAQAFSYQHRAVVSVESLRRIASSGGLGRGMPEPPVRPYERVVNLILLRSGSAADAREALVYTERYRAQTLAARLREAMGRSHGRGSERLLAEERDIFARLAFYQSRLQSGDLDPAERTDIHARIEEVERRFSKLNLEFENGERPHSDALYPRVEQPDELLTVLAPGERMLSFFLGERRSFLFSARKGVLEVFALPPRAAIEQRIVTFLGILRQCALEDADAASGEGAHVHAIPAEVFEFASRELYALLLGPVASRLEPGETLVIIPDGSIAALPFALLKNGDAYLVEHHDISYAPSLRALAGLRSRSAARRRSDHRPRYDVIAVGASGESAEDGGRSKRMYPYTTIPIEPLAGAEGEAQMVGSLFRRSLVLAGRSADESFFKASPVYDTGILHVAARAYVDGTDPGRSFLAFNPERSFSDSLAGASEDGLFRWHEAAALGLNAALVTISARGSARDERVDDGGIAGFAQAFLVAGAGCVLASQLDVPDRLAGEVMEEFYRVFRRGAGTAAALASAQRICLARNDALSWPVVWGAFCAIGDGEAALKRSRGPDSATVLAIVLLAAAAVALVWNLFQRRRVV